MYLFLINEIKAYSKNAKIKMYTLTLYQLKRRWVSGCRSDVQ